MKRIAVRNLRLCTKDCLCLYVCPTGATDTEDSIIDASRCIGCGSCADACPSSAISMVVAEYPPQQRKDKGVCDAVLDAADCRSRLEAMAKKIAAETEEDGLRRLMKAIAMSSRLSSEDLLREGGYMLPQSSVSQDLIHSLIADPPEGFPTAEARELLRRIPCNDREGKKEGSYRCSVCFSEFTLDDGEEAACPMCHAPKEKLERL